MDILANIRGLSYGLPDLYQQISNQGWEVKNVKYDSTKDRIVATATNPYGEEMSHFGDTDQRAVANLLYLIVQRNGMRASKLSMWKSMFTDQLAPIAEAYSKAKLYDPKAAIAFMELARDSENRAKALQEHLEITLTNNPEPYKSPEKMFDDIRKRRKLEVSKAGIDHPIWSTNQVIAYRIVHDVLGHAASGGGFDWEGENRAFAAHAAIIPVEAQKALFTESIASAAYATYYRAYGPLKIALFPDFMDPAQERENPHGGYRGIHPSQSHPPVPEPRLEPLVSSVAPDARIAPKIAQEGAGGLSGGLSDPNEGWSSGVAPLPVNAYLDHRDENDLDPLQANLAGQNASLINTEWAYLNQDDPTELAKMKLAITNAFRVVLLSPRKDLRWNAVHYQDIAHLPGDEKDVDSYWDTLENARQEWNVGHGHDRYSHISYYNEWKALEQLMFQNDPKGGWAKAQQKAKRRIRRWVTDEQRQLMKQDEHLPEEQQANMYKIELEANKLVKQRLQNYLKEYQPELDLGKYGAATMKAPEQMGLDMDVPQGPIPDKSKYGAWMGSHLQAIAEISKHVDDILKAALFDVHEEDSTGHRGTGHHFRAAVLSMNIKGVGPKVCSFAWLLLQPLTSQLATIDTHMMDVLGHHFEKDMSPRDYFKFERELAAGRDAAGYGHMPLGQFQWAMWDFKRTGPGSHQDHSAMRVLNPQSHENIDWKKKLQGMKGENWVAPDWWQATEPYRQAVGEDFDRTIASSIPQNQIPYNQGAPMETYSKVAFTTSTPWFKHPDTGEVMTGQPGQTIMQHMRSMGLDLARAWAIEDAGKR